MPCSLTGVEFVTVKKHAMLSIVSSNYHINDKYYLNLLSVLLLLISSEE